jgi:trimethylamine---corrinoid protein Co-methyltransferase
VQTAHEKTITGLIPALGGANQIYGAGMIESGVTIDYGVLVMDNDIARMAKFILRGIPTNDETLMVDEIIEVGSEEDFLSRMSTLKMMRAHQSKAGNIDRRVREEWEMDGGTDMYSRCNEKAKELVQNHKVEDLPSDVVDEIRAIVKKSEKDAGVA